ncbi:MAG: hypothetical protein CMK07_14575 [Ponticaulis sp.]|nr:hypothetical protein [Ponticaulis sp.]
MNKTVKFIIGIVIGVIAYAAARFGAEALGLGPLLASMIAGAVGVLAFFAAGKPLGYVVFRKK